MEHKRNEGYVIVSKQYYVISLEDDRFSQEYTGLHHKCRYHFDITRIVLKAVLNTHYIHFYIKYCYVVDLNEPIFSVVGVQILRQKRASFLGRSKYTTNTELHSVALDLY